MSAVADVLDGAADLIERHGWWHRDSPSTGGYDITGAISDAAPGAVAYYDALLYLRLHIDVQVSEWNNTPGRTKAEVVAALRAAAERARA